MKEAEFRGEHKLRTRIVLIFVVIVLSLISVASRPSESGEVMEVRSISCDDAEHYAWGEKCDGHYHKQAEQFLAGRPIRSCNHSSLEG